MPQIFDNIDLKLGDDLKKVFSQATSMDSVVGYFNLRGYSMLSGDIDSRSPGEAPVLRLLVGMAVTDETRLDYVLKIRPSGDQTLNMEHIVDNAMAEERRDAILQNFRAQLSGGAGNRIDFATLNTLRQHLTDGRVQIKAFAEQPLHAKAYILHTPQVHQVPRTAYVGSSNWTMAGMSRNLELNVDVVDQDSTEKLHKWFEKQWMNPLSIDVSADLLELLATAWVGDKQPTPYELYLKVCYNLSADARDGVDEYALPDVFEEKLLEYQKEAVKILAKRLSLKGGAMLGDVVGLGKTLTAVATAAVLQQAEGLAPLVVCPPNLVEMWEGVFSEYHLYCQVVPFSMATKRLPGLHPHQIVIVDESHTMRNSSRQDYIAIKEFIDRWSSRVLLLTATPYNTGFSDVSSQLGLYIDDDQDMGIEPLEAMAANSKFGSLVGGRTRTFGAFCRSKEAGDWKRLLGDHLVRRTRSFIRALASKDDEGEYMTFSDGQKFYFPDRIAKPLNITFDSQDPALLMQDQITLDAISDLLLPRNSLINYWDETVANVAAEIELKEKLEVSGGNLLGITRANFYKRLSSCGFAFELSVKRHIQRNMTWLYAIEAGMLLPVGSPRVKLADLSLDDLGLELDEDIEDAGIGAEGVNVAPVGSDGEAAGEPEPPAVAALYEQMKNSNDQTLTWVRPEIFTDELREALERDTRVLADLLQRYGAWTTERDSKLAKLVELITATHPNDKVLIFSEYKDTANYLKRALDAAGIDKVGLASGDTSNPTRVAHAFSPFSNGKKTKLDAKHDGELRVLIATDVLSEGQNLQDGFVIVNFDLPWAIIRLIQRAGRVDRIGQASRHVYVYSLFHESLEPMLHLRTMIRQRFADANKVFGNDEQFFGDPEEVTLLEDFYRGNMEGLEAKFEGDVDAVSRAYQAWSTVKEEQPELAKRVVALQDQVYATRVANSSARPNLAPQVLTYTRTGSLHQFTVQDAEVGSPSSPSPLSDNESLNRFEANPDEVGRARRSDHFEKVEDAAMFAADNTDFGFGYIAGVRKTLLHDLRHDAAEDVQPALQAIREAPLTKAAEAKLLKARKVGQTPAARQLMIELHEAGTLVIARVADADSTRIVCSMGVTGVE